MKQLNTKQLKKFYKQHNFEHNKDIVVILENIQYARNVASFFRTADASKVSKIILTGISPTPPFGKDLRKASRNKEKVVKWEYVKETAEIIKKLKKEGYSVIALELTDESVSYSQVRYPEKIVIVAGNESYGITKDTLRQCDKAVFIPMYGRGKSLNVHVALATLIFHIVQT